MQNSQIEVFTALNQAYVSGNTFLTDRVEAIVAPQEVKLPDSLQEILDGIKDTPIDEPQLFAILQKDNMNLIGFTEAITSSVNLDDFDALTASEFISRARLKILSKTDKDGVFKSTPSIDQVKLPRMSMVKKLAEAVNQDMPQAEFTDLAVSLAGIPESVSLTSWERDLIGEMFLAFAISYLTSLSGVASDRTPFARYLKNV